MDEAERTRKEQEEELLLLEQTRKMRERLKASRVRHEVKRRQIADPKVRQWMESLILITPQLDIRALSDGFLNRDITTWNELLSQNEEAMQCLVREHGGNLNEMQMGMVMDRWRASKREQEERERVRMEEEEERERMKEEKMRKKEKEIDSKKKECDPNVYRFLKEFGLLDLEFIFVQRGVDINAVAEIDEKWIMQNVCFSKSEQIGDLQIRLKMAVQELRKEIVREMRARMKRKHRQREDEMAREQQRWQRRRWLIAIHPVLGQIEETLSDPLYLLIIGFAVLMVFTLALFVIVGPGQGNQS